MGALVFDIAHVASDTEMWAHGARALLGIALVGVVPAALTGLIDFAGIAEARRHRSAWVHLIGNVAVATPLLVADLAVRLDDPVDAVRWEGFTLTVVLVLAIGVTGWAGGELAYRHGIGVAAEQPGVGRSGVAVDSRRTATADARSAQVRLAERAPDSALHHEDRLREQAAELAGDENSGR